MGLQLRHFPWEPFYINTVFFSDKDSVTQIQSFFASFSLFTFFCACIRPKEPVASCWLTIKEKELVAGDTTEDAVVLVYESTTIIEHGYTGVIDDNNISDKWHNDGQHDE